MPPKSKIIGLKPKWKGNLDKDLQEITTLKVKLLAIFVNTQSTDFIIKKNRSSVFSLRVLTRYSLCCRRRLSFSLVNNKPFTNRLRSEIIKRFVNDKGQTLGFYEKKFHNEMEEIISKRFVRAGAKKFKFQRIMEKAGDKNDEHKKKIKFRPKNFKKVKKFKFTEFYQYCYNIVFEQNCFAPNKASDFTLPNRIIEQGK
ncbi:hypothetical protein BpHYR1_007009 [Brachionus plicatilis]|uniref:Uncharacterized protein n=1 Tax=Brachionus plicatilis TaxID=10195 RepID=A0A3M7PJN7_BRAPC|nr:hypothetical protein BpHYR1_007009 [Brachionus plicatilis]